MNTEIEALGNLIGGKDKYVIAENILVAYDGNFYQLSKADESSIVNASGVSLAVAKKVRMVFEIHKMVVEKLNEQEFVPKFKCSSDIHKAFNSLFYGLSEERFYVALLSRANKIITHKL